MLIVIFHMSYAVPQLVGLAATGVSLGVLCEITRSIGPSLLVHMGINAAWLYQFTGGGSPEPFLVAAAIAGLAVAWLQPRTVRNPVMNWSPL